MDTHALRQQAIRIAHISECHRLEIEDFSGDSESGSERALFVWSDIETGASIHLTLQGNGNLISYSREELESPESELLVWSLQQRAEHFLELHYPNESAVFSLTKAIHGQRSIRFAYAEMCSGMPLPVTGWFAEISLSGQVIQFRYYGRSSFFPEISSPIPKDTLLPGVTDALHIRLAVVALNPQILDLEKEELRLVYVPVQQVHSINAETGELMISDGDDAAETAYISVPEIHGEIESSRTTEEIVGVAGNDFIKLREKGLGEIVGVVWGSRDRDGGSHDTSLDGFFYKRSAQTIKAIVNKSDGRVLSFMSFLKQQGPHWLGRQQCLTVALRFLKQALPDYTKYLQLKVTEGRSPETSSTERFQFRIRIKDIPVYLQLLTLDVNRTTGRVVQYSGLDFNPALLAGVPVTPMIDENRAKQIYLEKLDLKLSWKRNRRDVKLPYQLIYTPVHRDKEREIRCIDAITGELICSNDKI